MKFGAALTLLAVGVLLLCFDDVSGIKWVAKPLFTTDIEDKLKIKHFCGHCNDRYEAKKYSDNVRYSYKILINYNFSFTEKYVLLQQWVGTMLANIQKYGL